MGARVLVLGLTQTASCPDLRQGEVESFVRTLEDFGAQVDVYDPCACALDARRDSALNCLTHAPKKGIYNAVVLAVAHQPFLDLGPDGIRAFGQADAVLYDPDSELFKDAAEAAV